MRCWAFLIYAGGIVESPRGSGVTGAIFVAAASMPMSTDRLGFAIETYDTHGALDANPGVDFPKREPETYQKNDCR